MRDSDYGRLQQVVMAGHSGDGALVATHLDDPDPRVRAAALGAMARLGTLDDSMVTSALADPDRTVRRRATVLAAGRPGATGALLAALGDEDSSVAESAAFALGEGDPDPDLAGEVTRALAAVVEGHEDALCREAAAAALGSLGDPAGLPAVLAACGDRATIRRRAVLALAAFEGTEVTAMLESLCADRDLQVRQAAEDLLGIERGTAS